MYYLSVSFSYLRSAAGVSFDIKKACGKPYRQIIGAPKQLAALKQITAKDNVHLTEDGYKALAAGLLK